jgi:hypothetical protein
MSLYKRGPVYWYKFMWNGKLVRESTKQGNDKGARNKESAHRTSLAKGKVEIRKKRPAFILSEFLSLCFEPWAQARFERNVPKTWLLVSNGYGGHPEIQTAGIGFGG